MKGFLESLKRSLKLKKKINLLFPIGFIMSWKKGGKIICLENQNLFLGKKFRKE
ncbi:MAG: hypothetical protein WBF83_07015 [Moheibacter sp.]